MPELNVVIDDLGRSFEEFKRLNDERLAQIEKKGVADAALVEKLERVNAAVGELSDIKAKLDEVEKLAGRVVSAGGAEKSDPLKTEYHEKFVSGFLRKGREEGLADLAAKAMQVSVDSSGGYAVPEEIDKSILNQLVKISRLRDLFTVVNVSTSVYKKLVNVRGTTSGWVGETQSRTETSTPEFKEVQPPMGELYAEPKATQEMLDDAWFDVEAFIVGEIATEFAQEEGWAFLRGSGILQPKGLLAYTTAATADATRDYGTFQHIASGSTGIADADKLIDVVHYTDEIHRAAAVWLANSLTYGTVRKLKDTYGQYLWQPSLQAGTPAQLLGYPCREAPDMPDVASNALAMAFGNFKAAYTIVDRMGTRMLRDPFTSKPWVKFYTTKRVGGGAMNTQAVKFLKCTS
jgi:HK97 family phage major capsid protein